MKNYRKLKAKNLKKDHRWEYITLEGYFGNKRRIEEDIKYGGFNLHIYGKHRNDREYFSDFSELRGILKGIFLGNTIDKTYLNLRGIYHEFILENREKGEE